MPCTLLLSSCTVTAPVLHPGVTINTYKVIYNLIDDVKAAMEGRLRAVEEKQQLGQALVSWLEWSTTHKTVQGSTCKCLLRRGGKQLGHTLLWRDVEGQGSLCLLACLPLFLRVLLLQTTMSQPSPPPGQICLSSIHTLLLLAYAPPPPPHTHTPGEGHVWYWQEEGCWLPG